MSLEKIAALLAKSEATDNEHESSAFMEKAQMLATTYSIDLAVARQHTAKTQKREQPTVKNVELGQERALILKHFVSLFTGIATTNDLKINVAHNSTYVILFGMPSDIEVAEALFASLSYQMVEAGNRYIASKVWKGEAFLVRDRWGYENGWKEYTAKTARTAFYIGWVQRVTDRLHIAQREAVAAYKAAEAAESTPAASGAPEAPQGASGTDLVLKAKKDEVGAFYKQKSRARGSWKGYSGSAGGVARNHGRSAADSARLGTQRGIGTKAGVLT